MKGLPEAMEVPVKNQNGDTVDTVELDDAVFSVPMNHALVHQALVIYQSNKRQGTHDTKTRAEVSGGGRKPWVQKHTGRARQGSIRAPQWRHGGVVFGPHPRSYRKALPRRMRRLALKCVLSEKARQNHLVCLDTMDSVDGKTKSMLELLANLGITGSALVITRDPDDKVIHAARNLKKVWTLSVNLLNAQELLSRETVVMTLAAARWAEETLATEPHGRRGQPTEPEAVEAGPVEEPGLAAEPVEPLGEERPVDQAEDSELENTEEQPDAESAG